MLIFTSKLPRRILTIFVAAIFTTFVSVGVSSAQEVDCSEAKLRNQGVAIIGCVDDAQTCSIPSGAGGGQVGGKVYMIGDSIAEGSKAKLEQSIGAKGFSPVFINALASRTLTEGEDGLNGLGVLERDKTQFSDATNVIIELGTNSSGLSADNIKKAIDIVKSSSPGATIYWVNVGVDNSKRSQAMDGDGLNRIISDNATLGYSVIDWAAKVKEKPDYIDGGDGLGVHLTPAGVDGFAETVASHITGGTVSAGGGCVCSNGLSGGDNAEKVWNFFIEKGLKPFQVAGIMGNMQEESGFEPRLVQYGMLNSRGEVSRPGEPSSLDDTPPPGAKTGYGLVQFTPATKIIPEAQRLNMKPSDILFQLTLIWEQLNGESGIPEKTAGDHLKATTTVEEASKSFEYEYERHAVNPKQEQLRINHSIDFLTRFGSNTGSATSSSGSTTCGGGNGEIVGGVSLPLDRKWYDEHPNWFTKPHHSGRAASDIPVPTGTPVYSITAGTITSAPNGGGYGQGVTIDAGNGIEIIYGHGIDGGAVEGARQGDKVTAGQMIMTSGNTGSSTGPHLHVEIRINGQKVCPQELFTGIVEGSPPAINSLPTTGCF